MIAGSRRGRLVADLAKLDETKLVIPNDEFFIRTRYPDELNALTRSLVLSDGVSCRPGRKDARRFLVAGVELEDHVDGGHRGGALATALVQACEL